MRFGTICEIPAECVLARGNPKLSGILDLFSESKMSRFKFLVALNAQSTLQLRTYVEIFDSRHNIHQKIWLKGEVLRMFFAVSTISVILKPFKVLGIIVHNASNQSNYFFRINPLQPLEMPQSSTIVSLWNRISDSKEIDFFVTKANTLYSIHWFYFTC